MPETTYSKNLRTIHSSRRQFVHELKMVVFVWDYLPEMLVKMDLLTLL